MNHSLLYMPSLFKRRSTDDERELLCLQRKEFLWPAVFLLSMSLTGLHLYPFILVTFGVLMRSFSVNRYDFAIMTFFLFGGYSLMPFDLFPFKFCDFALLAGIFFAFVLKKTPQMKMALWVYMVYVAVLVWIAMQSYESMRIQLLTLRMYSAFIAVFVPIAIFANREFDLRTMVRRLMVYVVTICFFILIDAFILKAHYLLPNAAWDGAHTIFDQRPHLLSLSWMRVYPHAIFFCIIPLVPALRMFRIRRRFWVLLFITALATQTFTFICALAVTLILFQGSVRRVLRIAGVVLAMGAGLYIVDSYLPISVNEYGFSTSTLRIYSQIDQFVKLADAMDDEDLAEFGSGRMAQAIPKLELVALYKKEWTGLGFLHQQYTTGTRFQISNEYYTDVTQSEEVATGVEVVPLQLYISGGWALLIAVNVFYIGLWLIIRRMRYSYIYLSTLVYVMVLGLGGFCSPATFQGVQLLSFSFAMVILAERSENPERTKGNKEKQSPLFSKLSIAS